MTEPRYQPNGTPLTDHERELMVILMEECCEVAQAAAKLIRFGKENRPDNGISNIVTLSEEIGDVYVVIEQARRSGMIDLVSVDDGKTRKRERLARFMQTEP